MAEVSVKLNRTVIRAISKRFNQGTVIMAGDIARQARFNAPVLTGNLQSSIRVEERKGEVVVIAGGSWNWNVPYARRQEYEHKTKKHYMLRAKNTIMSGNWIKKYYTEA